MSWVPTYLMAKTTMLPLSSISSRQILVTSWNSSNAIPFLNELGFKTHMLAFLQKSVKQHSTNEANMTRFVTKVLWVVKAANSRIKRWKFLDNVVRNSQIPHIKDFVRIICAIINKYRLPLKTDNQDDDSITQNKFPSG